MNSNVVKAHVDMSTKELMEQVNETIVPESTVKKFKAIDLWHIEKSRKTALRSSKRWNLN